MNWDDLRVVLAVHRAGSMSRAARILGVDQSTATRRLAAVERDLGATLFIRSNAGMRANDAGRVVVEEALVMEQRAERLQDRLPHRSATPTGSVRLLSNPWLLTQLAARGLAALRRDYPELELLTIAGTRQRSIASGEIDMALWFEVKPAEGEFAAYLCDVTYALYAPAGVDPDSVEWMSIWNVIEGIEPMRWLSQQLPPDHRMALKTNDPPQLQEAIAAGLGKALIPACMGSRDPRLERVRGSMPDVHRKLHLHVHPDVVQSPRIQGTMDWLRSVVGEVFADPDADG